MRLVSWNCSGAFRKKFESIADFNADLYIIQECENPAETRHNKYQNWAENYVWIGDSKHKGLAIFGRPGIDLNRLEWSNKFTGHAKHQIKDHSVKHFLPCSINQNFKLLAVWTHRNDSKVFGYIGQFWKYLQINKDKLNNIIIAGDLNSSVIWDKWDRWWNHSDVVNELKELGIESLYHKYTGEQQGKESKPTLYFQRKAEKPYHIDYFFGAKKFSDRLMNVEIGQIDKWLEISDHMPIMCEFDE